MKTFFISCKWRGNDILSDSSVLREECSLALDSSALESTCRSEELNVKDDRLENLERHPLRELRSFDSVLESSSRMSSRRSIGVISSKRISMYRVHESRKYRRFCKCGAHEKMSGVTSSALGGTR
jgi:hypothetical protein